MSVFIRTDVTGVKLYKKFILIGIGSSINIYDKQTQKHITNIKVLNGQKIYGIIPHEYRSNILVFGGKHFAVLDITCNDGKLHATITKSVLCDDWLHSGVWLDEDRVGLLTAHNVTQVWNVSSQVLEVSYINKNNSILYSGLLLALKNDIIAFSGTVYSEVIVQSCNDGPIQCLQGHKGVIFSISCNPAKGIIVTTSDDRSVRIWGINSSSDFHYEYKEYWKDITINCLFELYGHTARVMRNCILNECIVSVGEDSGICFWDYKGNLIRKIISHQNGCIWSVDADEKHLVTGGGDCAVTLHPLSLKSEYGKREIINFNLGTPKKLEFTARRNIVIINEDCIVYYDLKLNSYSIHKLEHESTYKMLSVSSCKQIIAVADMSGKLDIFIENCKGDANIQNIINTKLYIGKVLSMHWAGNRHLVFCSDGGVINVLVPKGMETDIFATFVLPQCKERWLTSCAIDMNKVLIVGDRCGRIHIYFKGSKNPVKSFDKVHGRYGATSIIIKNNAFLTTGRNGTVKYFTLGENIEDIKQVRSKDVEFQWVEKFIWNESYLCGFDERIFVVYDIENNSKILEVNCGGGHRSWDVIRYIDKEDENYKEFIKFIFVKNSNIHQHTFQIDKILSVNVINGTHSKEINCMKSFLINTIKDIRFFITGGEDTTLRISKLKNSNFKDELIFKHLSSVRSIRVLPIDENKLMLVSAGGRAQVCVRTLKFVNSDTIIHITSEELVDYLIKGTDKERKGNQTWKSCTIDFDPETRIMDLEILKTDNNLFIITACSDATMKVFSLTNKLTPIRDIKHHKTCILKTHLIKYDNKNFLATCSSRSEVTIWDVTRIDSLKLIYTLMANKSGINAIASKEIDKKILIGTGGDDNAIHLNLLKVDNLDDIKMSVSDTSCIDKYHSSQVTGLIFVDDMMVSASIDQRVTMFKLNVGNGIECEFVAQTFSDVADIQGMELLEFSEITNKQMTLGRINRLDTKDVNGVLLSVWSYNKINLYE